MASSRFSRLFVAVASTIALATAVISAHEVTYQGTVLAFEPARVEVKTVDAATKKETDIWFAVDRTTKVKRGTATVTYAAAALAKGERIVVLVDHDAETKMLATEIRLAAKK